MRTLVLIDGQSLFHLASKGWAPSPARYCVAHAWPQATVLRAFQVSLYVGTLRAPEHGALLPALETLSPGMLSFAGRRRWKRVG